MKSFDPYQALGVFPDATHAAIKAAYKRRARETHPDMTKSENADEFHDVNRAWLILSDPEKRKIFDETGQLPDDVSRERREVADTLAAMFEQAIASSMQHGRSLKTVNFIQAITDRVNDGVRKADAQITQMKAMRLDLDDLMKRIRRSDEEDNAFSSHLTRKIAEIDRNIEQQNQVKRIAELMLVELGNYTNEVDLVRTMSNFSSSTSTGFGQWTRW